MSVMAAATDDRPLVMGSRTHLSSVPEEPSQLAILRDLQAYRFHVPLALLISRAVVVLSW